jgi:hypothetical protein
VDYTSEALGSVNDINLDGDILVRGIKMTIIGLKKKVYRCDNCSRHWITLTGNKKCTFCGSPNITLGAIFGHGEYHRHDKRVNGEYTPYYRLCMICGDIVKFYRKCFRCEQFVCKRCEDPELKPIDRIHPSTYRCVRCSRTAKKVKANVR